MNKKSQLGILVTGIIILFLSINTIPATTSFSIINQKDNRLNFVLSSRPSRLLDLSLVPHLAIEITHDDNFTDYGLPGLGTKEDPYVIENYNITTTSDKGIYITGTTKYYIIRNCYVDADRTGIFIDSTNYVVGDTNIVNNTCTQNRYYGIHINWSVGANVTNNTCTYNGYHGIMDTSRDSVIINNICNNNDCYGIYLWGSSNAIVSDNTCKENSNGIYLEGTSNLELTHNIFTSNINGICLWRCSYNTLIDNICSENRGEGIETAMSSWIKMIENICDNNGAGIYINDGDSNNLTANVVTNNKRKGICLTNSASVMLYGNTCKNNSLGIEIINSSDFCLVTYNVLEENVKYGVSIGESIETDNPRNNTIHHNTFIKNNLNGTSQAFDEGKHTTWYEELINEGNYWSEWRSKNPYPIDGNANSTDPYPLSKKLEKISYEIIMIIPSFFLMVAFYCTKRKRKTIT